MAVFSLYHTIRGEKKYRLNSFAASDLKKFTINSGNVSKASRYEAANYFLLEDLFGKFRSLYPSVTDILDVGCGKGRALVVAAHYGFRKLTGVEFAKELCEDTRENLENLEKEIGDVTTTLACADILDYPLTNENVFFLFNPFNEEVLGKLLDNIELSRKSHPRTIYIIYVSPRHRDVLEKHQYKIVYEVQRVRYLEGLIAQSSG